MVLKHVLAAARQCGANFGTGTLALTAIGWIAHVNVGIISTDNERQGTETTARRTTIKSFVGHSSSATGRP